MAAKIITIANMKGGVGKTTLAVSLSDGLAYARKRKVLVIDLDPQINSSQVLWGIEGNNSPWSTGENVSSFLNNWRLGENYRVQNNIIRTNIINRDELFQPGGRISLLSGSPELRLTERRFLSEITPLTSCEAFFHNAMQFILDDVRNNYHAIIIDCPPGISILAEAALKKSDMIIVPVAPTRLASEGIRAFSKFICEMSIDHKMKIFLSRMANNGLSETFRNQVREKYSTLDNEYKDQIAFAVAVDYLPQTAFSQKYGNVKNQVVSLSHEVAEKIGIGGPKT